MSEPSREKQIADLVYALEQVDANGFGDCVDDDAVIERAARAYLDMLRRAEPGSSPAPDNSTAPQDPAERIAREQHETYERLAPEHGYQTRARSAVPFDQVPPDNRGLMIATARDLLRRGVIIPGLAGADPEAVRVQRERGGYLGQ